MAEPALAGRAVGPASPFRVPRRLVDPILHELGRWLDGGPPIVEPVRGRLADRARQRLVVAHGLAPFLVRDPGAASRVAASEVAAAATPGTTPAARGGLAAWLAEEDARNERRVARMLEELAAALRSLAAAGVGAMPLKGAVLATLPGRDPFRRPMADLDLLVRPAELAAARRVLTTLGYRRRPDRTRRPTHDTFELPGSEQLVTAQGEHPDNPRPIELHVEVKRHLWGWTDDDALTAFLWAGSHEGRIAGEPAVVATDDAFLAHLAIHATSDLLQGRGRLVQWLDLADAVAILGPAPGENRVEAAGLPHPRLVYPSLRLAGRRLPSRLPWAGAPGLEGLETRVPARLARWVEAVPLDSRAGLEPGRFAPGDASSGAARWSRWAPLRWRLAVAYGDLPLPVAALRHAARAASAGLRRPS